MTASEAFNGACGTFHLAGKTWPMRDRLLRNYAEIEDAIREKRGNPLQRVLPIARAAGQHLAEVMFRAACAELRRWHIVTQSEIDEWLDETLEGRAFKLWLAIRDNDPEKLTREYVLEHFIDEQAELVDFFAEDRRANPSPGGESSTDSDSSASTPTRPEG